MSKYYCTEHIGPTRSMCRDNPHLCSGQEIEWYSRSSDSLRVHLRCTAPAVVLVSAFVPRPEAMLRGGVCRSRSTLFVRQGNRRSPISRAHSASGIAGTRSLCRDRMSCSKNRLWSEMTLAAWVATRVLRDCVSPSIYAIALAQVTGQSSRPIDTYSAALAVDGKL